MHPMEVKVLDINSAFYGVPPEKLMENAGKAVADIVIKKFRFKKCTVICGSGNNGGDGLVSACYLSKKCHVEIIMVEEAKSSLSRKNLRRAKKLGIPVHKYGDKNLDEAIRKSDLIIDAMLGIGISGDLREPYSLIVKKINDARIPVISVDIPTGLGGKISIKPDVTVTFHDKKDGMTEKNSGKIVVRDIGVPEAAVGSVGPGDMIFYPVPRKNSHKGENGTVLTIGGGPYTGAPALAAMAALRTGSDLSFVFVPEKIWKVVASFSPDIIAMPLEGNFLHTGHVPSIKKFLGKTDAVVIGPGLGSEDETKEAIDDIISQCMSLNKSMVVDADAIQVFGERKCNGNVVITPHAGEFKELTGVTLPHKLEKRKEIVRKEAKKRNCTILLKGAVDLISDGNAVKINNTHNEAMTVGGTGDVLSGIVGSLLSKNVPSYNAARIGAFVNGTAGNFAFEKKGYGMTATDLLEEIPEVLMNYLP
ncbi:MAG: NAD(P)H-hydrate dehydratase [Candidatus Thermoplasmatota archaeon]|nr:NAD(P)H-hydrate dehydratase [Candidatus Thermoplasmatota archaeon]